MKSKVSFVLSIDDQQRLHPAFLVKFNHEILTINECHCNNSKQQMLKQNQYYNSFAFTKFVKKN